MFAALTALRLPLSAYSMTSVSSVEEAIAPYTDTTLLMSQPTEDMRKTDRDRDKDKDKDKDRDKEATKTSTRGQVTSVHKPKNPDWTGGLFSVQQIISCLISTTFFHVVTVLPSYL